MAHLQWRVDGRAILVQERDRVCICSPGLPSLDNNPPKSVAVNIDSSFMGPAEQVPVYPSCSQPTQTRSDGVNEYPAASIVNCTFSKVGLAAEASIEGKLESSDKLQH